jgi:hypothetical protein
MKTILVAASLVALASFLHVENAVALDDGEVQAMENHQRQDQCATVQRFADQPKLMGLVTGDPEKDTVAFPVINSETSCVSNQTGTTGVRDAGLHQRNAETKRQ